MSITRAQIARQLLAKGGMPMKEIKGQNHMLAYITPNEADKLVKLGGQETMTPEGIPAYPEYDNYGYSNQADFDQGNYAASTDSTVSGYADGNTNTGGGNTPPQITQASDYIPSKTKTNLARTTNFFLNPTISKYAVDKAMKDQYEKDKEIGEDVLAAMRSGQQYFGPVNTQMRNSYARTTGLTGPKGPPNNGGDNNVIIPPIFRSAQVPSDIESKPSDFDLYAALEGRENMNFGMNPNNMTGAMQRFSDGGEVRQAYGLGSFVKKIKRGVKKGIKGIKKFAKSDLGKAALLYAGGTYLGGMSALSGAKTNMSFLNSLKTPSNLKNLMNVTNFIPGVGEKATSEVTGELVSETAKKFNISNEAAFKYLQSEQGSKIPGLVKFGIPAAMGASYLFAKNEQPDDLDAEINQNYKDTSGLKEQIASYPEFRFQVPEAYRLADGGRIGYDMGGDVMMASDESNTRLLEQLYEDFLDMGFSPKEAAEKAQKAFDDMSMKQKEEPNRVMAQEGGIMNLGGLEKDYREGGFVPIGVQEKADDVPARLSKNEFVFTADAVRAAGGGSVDKGADLMYKTMKNLESRVG